MRVAGVQRKLVALLLLAMLGGSTWLTMGAGRPRQLVWVLLAGFALRVLLAGSGSRYDRSEGAE